MLRAIDEGQIRPDKLYKASDMAKLGCSKCEGCGDCCRERASAITLDSIDMHVLKLGLNASFDDLLTDGLIELKMVNGTILPVLAKKENADECIFLGADGRCRIHAFRPGICRMFPLARVYHEDGTFSYFLQEGECTKGNGVKIKISKWLDYANIRFYEQAVREYHRKLLSHRERCEKAQTSEELAALQKAFIQENFVHDIY